MLLHTLFLTLVAISHYPTWSAPAPSTASLTADQKTALEAFRQKVSSKVSDDYMKLDFYLLKWLEAKNWDLKDAEKKLSDSVAWRKKNKISAILSEDFSDVIPNLPSDMTTVDKSSRPVAIAYFGQWKIREMIKSGKQKRISRFVEFFQEAIVMKIVDAQKAGKDVTGCVLLVDMTGFTPAEHMCPTCAPVLMKFVDGMEANYPGFVEEVIVVNAPGTLLTALENAKGMMTEKTLKILKVFDEDKVKWQAYLAEKIDEDQRYAQFGGTKQ